MTGPNNRPTTAEPVFCSKNNKTKINIVTGITKRSKSEEITPRPSTADKTEMAGVIMASP